jgi:hypothetical protein
MANNSSDIKARPANDAYTGMLAVSLAALLIGCGVLYLDFRQYPSTLPPRVDYSVKERSTPADVIERQGKAREPEDVPAEDKDAPKDGGEKKDQ